MQRMIPYLGIIAALVLAVILSSLPGTSTVEREGLHIATTTDAATSTVPAIQGFSLPPLELPTFVPETRTAPPSRSGTAPKTTTVSVPAPTPEPSRAAPPVPMSGNTDLDAAATSLRAALVNIVCYVPAGSKLHSILGSGVFIDSKGIILTNAHVAQYFLLADQGAACTIRSGSPATDQYVAAPIFIPVSWLKANAAVLTQQNPVGTGEYDYALLAVTKSATRAPLPATFPSVSLATAPPSVGTPLVIASYGAQFLETNQILSALFPTIVFGSVKKVYTFASTTIDVLALGGSAAAQEGSSGGGVVDGSGKLVGTITTSTVEGETSSRSLDAITASYVRAAYASEAGGTLDSLLSTRTADSVADFAARISTLEAILTAHLP